MSVTFLDIHAMIAARPALALSKTTNTSSALAAQLERAQGCCYPEIKRPRAAFYASAYTANDIAITQDMLKVVANGKHGIQKFCAKLNADLRVYELTTDQALPQDGLKEGEAAHLLAYGLMAVEEHVDCLMIASLSAGFDRALNDFDRALGAEPDTDVFALAARYGGQDLCALLGAALSARMAKIPCVAGHKTGTVLTRALARIYPEQDSTLITAKMSPSAEPIGVLHHVYDAVGDLMMFEALPANDRVKDLVEYKQCG